MYHLHRLRVLFLMEQRINRNKHLHAVRVRIAHHFRQILNAVSCRLARTKSRRSDIDSVCPCLNSCVRYFLVSRRREEAKRYIAMPAVTDTFIECLVPY